MNKKIEKIGLFIGLVVLVPAMPVNVWWDSSWTKKVPIGIHNTGCSTLIGEVIKTK